jgi:hypothetical protein
MQYFVRSNGEIAGPFSLDEINARIAAKALGAEVFATGALGATRDEIAKAPEVDWVYLAEIPDITGLSQPARLRSTDARNTCLIGCMLLAVCFVLVFIVALMFS